MSTKMTTALQAIRESLKPPPSDLFSHKQKDLGEVLAAVRVAKWALPPYQRPQVWTEQQICNLVDSLLQGLPMGALLVSKCTEAPIAAFRPLAGVRMPDKVPGDVLHVLDGQQRLTALHRVFCEEHTAATPHSDRVFCLQIPGLGQLLVPPKSAKINAGNADKVEVVAVPAKELARLQAKAFGLLQKGYIPLYLLDPTDTAASAAKRERWLRAQLPSNLEPHHAEVSGLVVSLEEDLKNITRRLRDYPVPFIQVDPEYVAGHDQTIIQLYIALNTRGTKLSPVDVFVAHTAAELGWDLYAEFESVKAANLAWVTRYDLTDWGEFLRPFALVSKRPSSPSGVAKCKPADLKPGWDLLVKSWRATQEFMDAHLFSSSKDPQKDAPSIAPLYVVCALFYTWLAKAQADKTKFELTSAHKKLLTSYLWTSFAYKRYEKSADGKASQDFEYLSKYPDPGAAATTTLMKDAIGLRKLTLQDIETELAREKPGTSSDAKTLQLLKSVLTKEKNPLATSQVAADLAAELDRRCSGA